MRFASKFVTLVAICNVVLHFVLEWRMSETSLREKTTRVYIVFALGTGLLCVVFFVNLWFLEKQLGIGDVMIELNNATSDLEETYQRLSLYRDISSLAALEKKIQVMLVLLEKHQKKLNDIHPINVSVPTRLGDQAKSLQQWNNISQQEQLIGLKKLGVIFQDLHRYIAFISQREQLQLKQAVKESQNLLLLSFCLMAFLIILAERKIQHLVVRPLKKFELDLSLIAKGEFQRLASPSEDQEFKTFTNAFNRMLTEVEVRQKRMLQSDKLASLGVFSAGVAHELNNPLSNISTSCQLLMEELEDGDVKQLRIWLAQIDAETLRGQKIVRTMLDFGSKKVFDKMSLNLAGLITDTQVLIASSMNQYAARLSLNVPSDLKVWVDKQRIQQLLINLIQNALHAGGQGVHVKISALLCKQRMDVIPKDAVMSGNPECSFTLGEHFIEIMIADDGPGIPKESLQKIFDPFFTTSEPGQGAGLGLFIVQEIVKEHGGCLAITSRPNKGTKIIILLPIEEMKHVE